MSSTEAPRRPWPFKVSAREEKPTEKPCTDERMCVPCYTGQGECEFPLADPEKPADTGIDIESDAPLTGGTCDPSRPEGC